MNSIPTRSQFGLCARQEFSPFALSTVITLTGVRKRQRCYVPPKKGQQMRNVLLAAVCLMAFPMPAFASEIDCNGYGYGMKFAT